MFDTLSPDKAKDESLTLIVDEIDVIFKEEQEQARHRATERLGELYARHGERIVRRAICEFAFRERMRRP